MSDALEQLVERARAALAGTSTGTSTGTPSGTSAPERSASVDLTGAADNQVRAVVSVDGHLRSLTIDPALLRIPLADLAAAVRDAVNAALAARPARADLSPLVALLSQVRDDARGEMAVFTAGFQDVEAGVRAVRAAQHTRDAR